MKFVYIVATLGINASALDYPLPTRYRSLTQLNSKSKSSRFASIGGALKNEDDVNDMLQWTTQTIEGDFTSMAQKELNKNKNLHESSSKALKESLQEEDELK